MILSGKELKEKGIITNIDNPKSVQQVGIDVEVVKIDKVIDVGFIFRNNTLLPKYIEMEPNFKVNEADGWMLQPGYYQIWLKQGCVTPPDVMFRIRQRSSLLRSGAQIHSSIFDPGFSTDAMGTFMVVHREIWIEQGARVGQVYASITTPVAAENLYKGQFQGDKQKK